MWHLVRKLFKKKLDKVSPTFCLAKYAQSNIYLGTQVTHSCHYCPTHSISLEDVKKNLSSLHNTKEKIEQRKLMLEGKRPEGCNYCWNIEDSGNFISDRVTKSFSPWARNNFDNIVKSGVEGIDPSYLEISFDNRCNLKCSYCGPTTSSKWGEEIKRLGPWPQEIDFYQETKNIPHNVYNPYIDAFWEWLPKIYQNLHTFRITGGEPLLSKNTFKLLDYIKSHPNNNLTLGVNSNLAVPEKNLTEFIQKAKQLKVKKLIIHASCDSHGLSVEYARNGLNYDTWVKNVERILKELPNAHINIMATYTIFSVTQFLDFLKDIKKLNYKRFFMFPRISLATSYVREPEHLAVWVLPMEFDKYIISQIKYMKDNHFTSSEINQLERILSIFKQSHNKDKTVLQRKFYMFVNEHDRRRKTSFLSSFPEMTDFYETLKKEYDEN